MLTESFIFRLLCLMLPCVTLGCDSGDTQKRGDRIPVDGVVTINGQNLEAGRIVYITDQGAGEVKATAAIMQGYYRFDVNNGPLAGEARVEIYPAELELEEFESARGGDHRKRVGFVKVNIPAKYNVNSQLTATVQADAESNLSCFDLVTN